MAQGANRSYRNAHGRWLSKEIRARRPVFHRKNHTGAGSFLAASGVNCVRYDGHRIAYPSPLILGSVRMTRNLPEGIPYEVTIWRRNGRWYAAVAYWKESSRWRRPIEKPNRWAASTWASIPWRWTATA